MTIRKTLFAMSYDRQLARAEKAGLRAARESLLARAAGDVIEIGSGTGANLPCYGPAVQSLTLTEPEPAMMRRLRRKAAEQAPAARVLRAPAEDLPFDDHSFDVAVCTLVLCGVDDQPRALRELRRVLRPGGQLLFLEHVRSGDPRTARLQDRMNWLNRFMVCCDCNRPTLDTIRDTGFTIARVDPTTLPKAPPFVRPAIIGSAIPMTSRDSKMPLVVSAPLAAPLRVRVGGAGCRDFVLRFGHDPDSERTAVKPDARPRSHYRICSLSLRRTRRWHPGKSS